MSGKSTPMIFEPSPTDPEVIAKNTVLEAYNRTIDDINDQYPLRTLDDIDLVTFVRLFRGNWQAIVKVQTFGRPRFYEVRYAADAGETHLQQYVPFGKPEVIKDEDR